MLVGRWVRQEQEGESVQLREDAVEGCAGAACDGEEEPEGLGPEEAGHSVHASGEVSGLVEVTGHGGGEGAGDAMEVCIG